MTLTILLSQRATFNAIATLPLNSSLISNTNQNWITNSVLVATSSLSVNGLKYSPASVVIPATSSLLVNAFVYNIALETLPIVAAISVDTKLYRLISAVLPGIAILSADASVVSAVATSSAVIPATSFLSANTLQRIVASAILPVSSSLSANALGYIITSSTLGVSSSLNALVSIRWPSLAVLPLSSFILADSFVKGRVNADATLIPTSTLSAVARQLLVSQSVLTSSSIISSFIAQRSIARAQFDNISTLDVKTNLKWLALAKLASSSTINVSAIQVDGRALSFELALKSSLRADTIYFKLERHWRRNVSVQGTVGLPKQLRGIKSRTTLTGDVT